jgi:hypothetical protein
MDNARGRRSQGKLRGIALGERFVLLGIVDRDDPAGPFHDRALRSDRALSAAAELASRRLWNTEIEESP